MSESVLAFQNQLASIMEVFVRNTVCEITRLYEESFVNFQSIIAQHEEENATLKIKLQQSEKVLTLQAQRDSSMNGAESLEAIGHSDPLIKQEDLEGDVKIDTFCAVCGKAAGSEPPFCDVCRNTVSCASRSSKGSPAAEQSCQVGSAGNLFDFSKDPDANIVDTDSEAFPGQFEYKPDLCFNVGDPSAGSPVIVGSCPEAPAVPSLSQSGPSWAERRSSAKRPRHSPEIDNMAAEAKELVRAVLARRPEGDRVVEEYQAKGTLTDPTRRHLINMLVAHMTETQGRIPPKNVRELYALGIITLFPSLKDPFSKKGYEHFYDGKNGTGYLAWRLKTVQRKTFHRRGGEPKAAVSRGPSFERQTHSRKQLQGAQCEEAIMFLAQCTDPEQVFLKMRETFQYRQQLVHDPQKSGTVLSIFPRLLDTKGLVNQDFTLLFGLETSCKLLENWDSSFKAKVIKEARSLTQSADLCNLLKCAEYEPGSDQDLPEVLGWDSDMASILLLVHLLPPPPGGRKSAKISAREAVDRIVQFQKPPANSRPEWCPTALGGQRQPYLVAVGCRRDRIQSFHIALDGCLLPCQAACSLGAFDELFKAHFVFGLSYDEALSSVYTFLQTTVYNIDVGSVRESPRVKELRARLLNNC